MEATTEIIHTIYTDIIMDATAVILRLGYSPAMLDGLRHDNLTEIAALASADGQLVDDVHTKLGEILVEDKIKEQDGEE